jgi:transcriptional regulator with XRE-family HTH domain
MRRSSNLFPALIRHWRTRRGHSQLDLALAADVSARHISFLETGRAQPSREMILRLSSALSVPLRDQNALLVAAGFPEAFAEPNVEEALAGPMGQVIDRMLAQQEPFPMVVMNRRYDILRVNRGGTALLLAMLAEPAAAESPTNVYRLLFDPRLARPYVVDWERVAKGLLVRLHRESLQRPADVELGGLLRSLFEYPGVPASWQEPDLSAPVDAVLTFRLRREALELAFVSTVTSFSAPQNVTLEELRIETFFPLDEATRRACEHMLRGG